MCFMKCLGMVVHPTNRLGGLVHSSYLRGHCPHIADLTGVMRDGRSIRIDPVGRIFNDDI